VVLTGGEPLAQHSSLANLCKKLFEGGHFVVDVETNATIVPAADLDRYISTYVCSPKLANSEIPAGFRLKHEALKWFASSGKSYFKFVVDRDADFGEIEALVKDFGISRDRVYLMPRALTPAELEARQRYVADKCLEYGYRYSDRLHLKLYGGGRGV
jgi:organic radical activating enzyme